MLKRIALVGLFVVASALSFSTTASTATARPMRSTDVMAPKAPVPQGFCPNHYGC
jgi:hypothetical protein